MIKDILRTKGRTKYWLAKKISEKTGKPLKTEHSRISRLYSGQMKAKACRYEYLTLLAENLECKVEDLF